MQQESNKVEITHRAKHEQKLFKFALCQNLHAIRIIIQPVHTGIIFTKFSFK